MDNISVNAIYATYQGEVNVRGIGAPVIFLRLQGCHIRCYKRTLGTLCDTPEALQKDESKGMPISMIIEELIKLRRETGINFICLSGGDPLWRDPALLKKLFSALTTIGFHISIETSGTIPIAPFFEEDFYNSDAITWVLDYKTKSAGIKNPFIIGDIHFLSEKDFIKFVLYDDADYKEFLDKVLYLKKMTKAKIAVGPYWGGKLTFSTIFDYLRRDGLLPHVTMNTQLHKMTTFCELRQGELTQIEIPKLI